MTTAKSVANVILDSGETNELTVYTESCEKILSKQLTNITPPQSVANYASGPKSTKIVDLLRIETRFTVRGKIDSADETKLENLMNDGGTFTFTWKGTSHNVNFQKIAITNDNKSENDETSIIFTAIVGVNI